MQNRTILMCPPDYYRVRYAINPWMEDTKQGGDARAVNPERARTQWHALKNTLERCGFTIKLMEPDPSCPDLVFTANAGLVHPKRKEVLLSNFLYPQRMLEVPHFRRFFETLQYDIQTVEEKDRTKKVFEGAGDVLLYDNGIKTIYGIGWGFLRTNMQGAGFMESFLGENQKTVMLRLIDPNFYHLDTCFCPVGKYIFYYPPAFLPLSQEKIRTIAGDYAIEISKTDAHNFVCNGVAVPPQKPESSWKFITNRPSEEFILVAQSHDIEVIPVELDEFIKAGGAAKCLTLMIHDD